MSYIEQIFREFDDYEKKIELLKTIESELNRLDTKGFEYDVKKIRARLKSPKDALEVKKEFIYLKDKIEKRREKERREREKWEQENKETATKKIAKLISETENLLRVSLHKAANAKNPMWLASLIVLSSKFNNKVQKYKSGEMSLLQAENDFKELNEQLKILSTPLSFGESENGSKKISKQTYYEILDVSPGATQEEITNSYRKLIKACHVDKVQNSPSWIQDIFREMDERINEAYNTLSDPKKRKKYDENPKKI